LEQRSLREDLSHPDQRVGACRAHTPADDREIALVESRRELRVRGGSAGSVGERRSGGEPKQEMSRLAVLTSG
jgi:hypothetical protein